MTESSPHLRLGSIVFNCADLERMTSFWTAALGLVPGPLVDDGKFRVLGGTDVNMSLQLADTPVTARDQAHLDLYTDQQAIEVERLIGLGATFVRHNADPDDDYVVLTDPEANEFCVCVIATT